jgi:hypothetical protein
MKPATSERMISIMVRRWPGGHPVTERADRRPIKQAEHAGESGGALKEFGGDSLARSHSANP